MGKCCGGKNSEDTKAGATDEGPSFTRYSQAEET
jgi:hypothetical protein